MLAPSVCETINYIHIYNSPLPTSHLFRFKESYDDPHKPLPSPVVHIRGLVDGVMEADLVEALQEFGVVR